MPSIGVRYNFAIASHLNRKMNNFIRKINFDKTALGLISITAAGVLGEAAARTSLSDAQTAVECRYPPLSSILTEEHVRELEKNNLVVIHNVLSTSTLQGARDNVRTLTPQMEATNHSNDGDVRQDQILSIRENDNHDHDHDHGGGGDHHDHDHHGDALVHCIKLLRGIPFLLNAFEYTTSHSHVVPRQCQLARYKPDGSSVYVRHLDRCNMTLHEMGLMGWLRASDYRHRVVTAILYLNSPQWDGGGELRVFDEEEDGKHSDIVPSGGKLILFDSNKVEHTVLASHCEDRYALTCWFNGDISNVSS